MSSSFVAFLTSVLNFFTALLRLITKEVDEPDVRVEISELPTSADEALTRASKGDILLVKAKNYGKQPFTLTSWRVFVLEPKNLFLPV